MTSDFEIAQLLVALYDGPDALKAASAPYETFYEPGSGDHGIAYAVVRKPDENLILFRGSKSLLDWARDLFALPTVFTHKVYGPVHAGFSIGLDRAVYDASQHLDFANPTAICGHSLGGARAGTVTAMILENYQRDPRQLRRIVFGEPIPGFKTHADYIRPVESRSYCNTQDWHVDMVTRAVNYIPPAFAFVRCGAPIKVHPPHVRIWEEILDPFALHHIGLYAAALAPKEAA